MIDKKFTKAMIKLMDAVSGFGMSGEDISADVIEWFWDKDEEFENDVEAYNPNDDGLFYLIRDLMNYDFFWCTADYKIDVKNANHPEIAKIIKPWATPEIVEKVRNSFNF